MAALCGPEGRDDMGAPVTGRLEMGRAAGGALDGCAAGATDAAGRDDDTDVLITGGADEGLRLGGREGGVDVGGRDTGAPLAAGALEEGETDVGRDDVGGALGGRLGGALGWALGRSLAAWTSGRALGRLVSGKS
ncbi:MAG: hypothetical protein AAF436_02225 [Myxococcota bacterium]